MTDPSALRLRMQADQPITGFGMSRRALAICAAAGVRTVAEFLATPIEQFLKVKGCGRRTYELMARRLQNTPAAPAANETAGIAELVLPDAVLRMALPLDALTRSAREQLAALSVRTLGELLTVPRAALPANAERELLPALRQAIARALHVTDAGIVQTAPLQALQAALDDDGWRLLAEHAGIAGAPLSVRELARQRNVDHDTILARLANVRRNLLHDAAVTTTRLREDVDSLFELNDGVLTPDRLCAGSTLQQLADDAGGEPAMRLVAFLWPERLFWSLGALSTMSAARQRRLLRNLRAAVRLRNLPLPLPQVMQDLSPAPARGLVQHLVTQACRRSIFLDGTHGELIVARADSTTARLQRILVERRGPLRFGELRDTFRERHGQAGAETLRRALYLDPAFLKVGPGRWALRRWHSAGLQDAAATAERLAATMTGRCRLTELLPPGTAELDLHLVADQLRADRRVLALGRHEFRPRACAGSPLVEELLRDFRRAGGAVVLSLFLGNQPPARRRLVERLLAHSRMFVFPEADRVDVLTNYPFNDERLTHLHALVDAALERRGGYTNVAHLVAEINRTDLGGTWLHNDLLADLLRRNSRCEVLAGRFVALPGVALVRKLQGRVRAALRAAGAPTTVERMLLEHPELAEFQCSLGELMRTDPMVSSPDGLHWQLH